MFREMRRNKQALSQEECTEILWKGTSGVLSLSGDDGYPYGVPISYAYDGEKLYFHCARAGHKLDAIRRNGIEHLGTRVVTLTWGQARNYYEFEPGDSGDLYHPLPERHCLWNRANFGRGGAVCRHGTAGVQIRAGQQRRGPPEGDSGWMERPLRLGDDRCPHDRERGH